MIQPTQPSLWSLQIVAPIKLQYLLLEGEKPLFPMLMLYFPLDSPFFPWLKSHTYTEQSQVRPANAKPSLYHYFRIARYLCMKASFNNFSQVSWRYVQTCSPCCCYPTEPLRVDPTAPLQRGGWKNSVLDCIGDWSSRDWLVNHGLHM